MDDLKLDILRLSETHWKEGGDFMAPLPKSDGYHRVLYSGGEKSYMV